MNNLMWKITKGTVSFYKSVSITEVNRYLDKGYQVKRIW